MSGPDAAWGRFGFRTLDGVRVRVTIEVADASGADQSGAWAGFALGQCQGAVARGMVAGKPVIWEGADFGGGAAFLTEGPPRDMPRPDDPGPGPPPLGGGTDPGSRPGVRPDPSPPG